MQTMHEIKKCMETKKKYNDDPYDDCCKGILIVAYLKKNLYVAMLCGKLENPKLVGG